MLARFLAATAAFCMILLPSVVSPSPEDDASGYLSTMIDPTVRITFDPPGYTSCMENTNYNAIDPICCDAYFEVHANAQEIHMWCAASFIFKGDNPHSPSYIPLDWNTDAVITAGIDDPYHEVHELPLDEGVSFDYDFGPGFGIAPVYSTPSAYFDSGATDSWSYVVCIELCWLGYNAELPQGEYSAGIVLWASHYPIA